MFDSVKISKQFAFQDHREGTVRGEWLAAALVVGLFVIVPLITLLGRKFSLIVHPYLLPLATTAIITVAYGSGIWLLNEVRKGAVVGTVVFSTVSANIPLSSTANSFPGGTGPFIWLFYTPLVVATVACWFDQWWLTDGRSAIHWSHIAFAGFTLWTLTAIVTGVAVRPIVTLAFTWHIAVGLLTFFIISTAVFSEVVSLREVIGSFTFAILGHVAFAMVQVANQGSFGLTILGETPIIQTRAEIVGVSIGAYVSGFTGGSAAFASLVVLVVPIVAMFAVATQSRWKYVAAITTILMFVMIRLTERDATRGAGLVALASMLPIIILSNRFDMGRVERKTVSKHVQIGMLTVAMIVGSIGALGMPSSTSGTTSQVRSMSDITQLSGIAKRAADAVDGIGIPLLDLSTLGIRASQYAVAGVLFFKNPIVGIGGGNFPYRAVEYGLPAVYGDNQTWVVHNGFLGVLTETGLIGFTLFISVVIGGLYAAYRLTMRSKTEWWIPAGCSCGLLAFYVNVFWDVGLVSMPTWIALVILNGAIIGAYVSSNPLKSPNSNESVSDDYS
jgi:hypothetical protein